MPLIQATALGPGAVPRPGASLVARAGVADFVNGSRGGGETSLQNLKRKPDIDPPLIVPAGKAFRSVHFVANVGGHICVECRLQVG